MYVCTSLFLIFHTFLFYHFYSKAYRMKSIKDGLILFLTEEDHRGENGVHGKNGDKLNRYLKRTAEKAWINYYNKTKDDFRKRYGKNYL